MFTKKGFTLIELLVVIAIIGILASVVLVSFPSATKKAKDARVESAMSQMRALLVSYQSDEGSFTGFDCDTPSEMIPLCADVLAKGFSGENPVIEVSDDAACLYAALNAKGGASYYCIDSAGKVGVTETNPSTADCNGTLGTPSFICPADATL